MAGSTFGGYCAGTAAEQGQRLGRRLSKGRSGAVSIVLTTTLVLVSVLPVNLLGSQVAAANTTTPQLLQQAQAAIDTGDVNGAVELLLKVLEQSPSHREARFVLVDLFMRMTRWEDALNHLTILKTRFPQDVHVILLAAAVDFRRNEFQSAVQLLTPLIDGGKATGEAYRIRAFSRFMLEDYEGFKSDLEALIGIEPGNADAYYHLGRFYYENQQFTEGLQALLKATELDSGHFRALYFLGWCQQAQGDLASAKESYKRSIDLIEQQGVRYGWPFTDLGELLVTEGQYEVGIGWLYRGVRNDPTLPYCRYKYASALMKETPTGEVEAELLKAIELDPGYTEAYYSLGRYYQGSGEQDKAKQAFARFQELRKKPEASLHGVKRGR